jgi:hypothetical protein
LEVLRGATSQATLTFFSFVTPSVVDLPVDFDAEDFDADFGAHFLATGLLSNLTISTPFEYLKGGLDVSHSYATGNSVATQRKSFKSFIRFVYIVLSDEVQYAQSEFSEIIQKLGKSPFFCANEP